MRILQVVDSPWAIGKLAEAIKEGNNHHKVEILTIHPKEYRKDTEHWNDVFEEKVKQFQPQVIHFHYWDTAEHLSHLEVTSDIKKILTHHNQKNLTSHKWEKIDVLVVHTKKAKKILEEAGHWSVEIIQHGIDIEHFKYNDNYDPDNRQLGWVGRIVPWKNPVEVLKVAKETMSEVVMMGKVDKADLWQKCLEYSDHIDDRMGTPYEKQPNVFHEMGVYIGNSSDNIEEGTLGLLEAMACGIPVVTTPSGEAADIIVNGVNGLLVEFDNYNSLLTMVQRFLAFTPKEKEEMRRNAWDTVKGMSKQVMARKYEKLYYSIAYKKDLVSIIIPTAKRHDKIANLLDAYSQQSYSPIELVVVVDDTKGAMSHGLEIDELYEDVLNQWKEKHEIPIKWMYTYNEGYGLAQARNMGIFEAAGHYLIFNDDRFIPSPVAVEAFVNNLSSRKNLAAVWGDKGNGRRDFIENFFIIRRKHIAQAGMFNERINEYGGQSQEIRERLRNQGFELVYEPLAVAVAQMSSHAKTKKRYELFRSKLKLWKLMT